MNTTAKLEVKPRDLIELRTMRWRDKHYGMTYVSGQLYHNGNLVAVYPYTGSSSPASVEMWAGHKLEDLCGRGRWEMSLWRLREDQQVWVCVSHYDSRTKRECVAFGETT